jgi:hypothetical protein
MVPDINPHEAWIILTNDNIWLLTFYWFIVHWSRKSLFETLQNIRLFKSMTITGSERFEVTMIDGANHRFQILCFYHPLPCLTMTNAQTALS